jgi:hypothetical protein
MTRTAPGIDPEDVYITQHAVHQLLARWHDEVLPREPEATIRKLLAASRRVPRARFPWLSQFANIMKNVNPLLYLSPDGWLFVVRPNRHRNAPERWVLVTVLSIDPWRNQVNGRIRDDRIAGFEAFRSGRAFDLLASLLAETGRTDTRSLARLWRGRGFPDWRYGGYHSFTDFLAAARRAGLCRIEQDTDTVELLVPVPCPALPQTTL